MAEKLTEDEKRTKLAEAIVRATEIMIGDEVKNRDSAVTYYKNVIESTMADLEKE